MKAKYNNQKTSYAGIEFDSKKEATRYGELLLMQRAGLIGAIELQPRFALMCGDTPVKIRSKGVPKGRQCFYNADFRYVSHERGAVVIEDAKGFDTPASRLRRAVVEAHYGILITII